MSPLILQPLSQPTGTSMTRAQMKQWARHYIDEISETGRVLDTATGQVGLDDALTEAYVEYSKQVKCFPAAFSLTAVVDQATYASTAFDATGRLFEITAAAFNEQSLTVIGSDYLDSINPSWRFDPSAIPIFIMPFGELAWRLYPAPSDDLTINIEGYQTADLSTFTDDTDSPAIHYSRCRILSAYAAAMYCIRFAGIPEVDVQKSAVWALWTSGIAEAKKEIHGSHRMDIVVGRNAEAADSDWPRYNRGIATP